MIRTWQLDEAKRLFSELVATALTKGPQMVTKHGKPAVVVISADEHQSNLAQRKSLAAALRACPEDLTLLVGEGGNQVARKIRFGE